MRCLDFKQLNQKTVEWTIKKISSNQRPIIQKQFAQKGIIKKRRNNRHEPRIKEKAKRPAAHPETSLKKNRANS